MKKYSILIVLFLFVCLIIGAQTTTSSSTTSSSTSKNEKFYSKRGVYFFPEAGEYAIGIDALPVFKYAGNIFANNNTNNPSVNYGANPSGGYNAIYGKYFLTDKKAIRVRLGLKNTKNSNLYPVELSSLAPDAAAPAYGNDKEENFNRSYYIAAGLEKRRGNSRIQGVYGAEIILGFSQNITNYLYANSINANFNAPVNHNGNASSKRIIKDRTTQSFQAALRAFAGFEYFIAPKVSLGGEFGYSLKFQNNGIRQQTYEYWNPATSSVSKITNNSNNDSFNFIGLDTDNLTGAINLFFYF